MATYTVTLTQDEYDAVQAEVDYPTHMRFFLPVEQREAYASAKDKITTAEPDE